MANDKKSSRSFDLDKGGKRSFDLEKKSTRAFDLTKDETEVVASPTVEAQKNSKLNPQPTKAVNTQKPTDVPPTPIIPSDYGDGNEGGSSKKWLWIILTIIVLAILVYLFIPGGCSEATPNGEDSTEVVIGESTSTEPLDSVSADSIEATANLAENVSNDNGSESVSNLQTPHASSSSSDTPSSSQQLENVDNSSVSGSSHAVASDGNIEEQALKVIKGVYGNNPERRRKLGADYNVIQKRVNELMRR